MKETDAYRKEAIEQLHHKDEYQDVNQHAKMTP